MSVELLEICCDSCPYYPTCEEINDFHRDIGLLADECGDETWSSPDLAGALPG